MNRLSNALVTAGLLLAVALPAGAGALLEPIPAPEWKIDGWINGSPGGRLSGLKGKVVVIEFFQLWCPTCNNFSLPLMAEWEQKFADRNDVVLVSIHSVFEGHDLQSPALLAEFVRQHGITRPVGVDAYENEGDAVPISMERFEARGTPHLVIVDKKGLMRFSHFGWFDRGPVEAFIERLAEERANESTSVFDKAKSGNRGKRVKTQPAATAKPTPPKPVATLPKADDDSADPEISGTYKLVFEQTSKTCGEMIKPQQLIAELVFGAATVKVRSVRPYLGLRRFEAAYQPASGTFEADLNETARQKGAEVELSMEIRGRLDRTAEPPAVEFEFALDKRGGNGEWDCYVGGKGTGTLTRPGR